MLYDDRGFDCCLVLRVVKCTYEGLKLSCTFLEAALKYVLVFCCCWVLFFLEAVLKHVLNFYLWHFY